MLSSQGNGSVATASEFAFELSRAYRIVGDAMKGSSIAERF